MNFIRRSLNAKILIPVSIVTILTFLVLNVTVSSKHRSFTNEMINASSSKISSILLNAVSDPMSIGDNEGTEAQLDKVRENYPDITVFLTNFKGNVTYSTHKDNVRKDLATIRDNAEFTPIFEKSLTEKLSTGTTIDFEGKNYFVAVSTIANEEACHHCHGKTSPILGSMVLFQDISPQMHELASEERFAGLLSAAGALFLLIVLGLFIRRIILGKIVTIASVSDRIREGDYSAKFEVRGHDELGSLADNLRAMVKTVRDQLEYNKGVLQGIIIPLFVTDEKGKINYINAPLRNIFGMTEEQILGQTMAQIIYGEDGKSVACEVIESGSSQNGQMDFTRSDGVQFPLHYEISPLTDVNGHVVGAIGMMIDLTQEERDKERIRAQRENLLEVANQVTEVASQLSAQADSLSEQMNELTQGMDETSGQTTQAATAMEEMNATVLEVAQNASRAAEASDNASRVANDGGEEVGRTVAETREMARTTEALSATLEDLSTKAENIGQVMAVINDIADQTNLLALNAAIEAARAGDAGRGFAVVADEVRKLAEKTMGATQEVDAAIGAIQDSAKEAVTEMSSTKERAEHTEQMAAGAGNVLQEIVKHSDGIADMVRSIATAAEQQSSTSEEININVNSISELSQTINQRIGAANTSIQEVAEMSRKLNTLVEQFKN